jgi:hypothetical protein
MNLQELEKQLEDMDVPAPLVSGHEARLKEQIHQKYFNQQTDLFWKMRLVSTTAIILAAFLITIVVNPNIAFKANRLLSFNNSDESFQDTDLDKILTNLDYTSINNPRLKSSLDPAEFSEDKAYLIRKYSSDKKGSVMIVSEFEPEVKQKLTSSIASSY